MEDEPAKIDFEAAQEAVLENLDMPRRDLYSMIQNEFGYNNSFKSFTSWIGRVKRRSINSSDGAGTKKDVIPSTDFLSGIDVPGQVIKYLDDVVGDNYIENDKLRKHFEIGTAKWREIGNLAVFVDRVMSYRHGATNQRVVVWSSKAGIEAAKSTLSMGRYDK